MLKKFLLALCMVLPMLASAQTIKIGFVDTDALIAALPEAKTAEATLKSFAEKIDAEYKTIGDELQRQYEEVQKLDQATTPQSVYQRKIEAFQALQQRAQEFEQKAQQDIMQKRNELMAPIQQKIMNAIESVGKEGNFTLIQPLGSSLYYGAPASDITSLVKSKLGI